LATRQWCECHADRVRVSDSIAVVDRFDDIVTDDLPEQPGPDGDILERPAFVVLVDGQDGLESLR
jgi:hypothetical protein